MGLVRRLCRSIWDSLHVNGKVIPDPLHQVANKLGFSGGGEADFRVRQPTQGKGAAKDPIPDWLLGEGGEDLNRDVVGASVVRGEDTVGVYFYGQIFLSSLGCRSGLFTRRPLPTMGGSQGLRPVSPKLTPMGGEVGQASPAR